MNSSGSTHGSVVLAPRSGAGGARLWEIVLGILVAVRVAIPLVTLAFSGRALPGLPAYVYRPLNGDSFGYYAAAREFISSLGMVSSPSLAITALLVLVAAATALTIWRRAAAWRWLALLMPPAAVAFALVLPIRQMHPPGAPVFGWPLVWSIPLIPIRVLGLDAGPDVAFAIGLVLTLAALAVAVVGTAYVGLYATGRRSIGLLAGGLFAVWPLLSGHVAGHSAWRNGQWNVDVGLHLYTEPLSTALVVVSVALLLRPASGQIGRAGAGLAIGYATLVKLTNGLTGAVLAILVAWRYGIRAAVPYALGGLVSLPLVAAYWSKGYVGMFAGGTSPSDHTWSVSYLDDAWRDSLLFTPRLLVLLAPLCILGCLAIRDRWALAVVAAPIVVNGVVYSLYYITAVHPRFLYVALPFLFVIESAGAVAVADALRRRRHAAGQVRVL